MWWYLQRTAIQEIAAIPGPVYRAQQSIGQHVSWHSKSLPAYQLNELKHTELSERMQLCRPCGTKPEAIDRLGLWAG